MLQNVVKWKMEKIEYTQANKIYNSTFMESSFTKEKVHRNYYHEYWAKQGRKREHYTYIKIISLAAYCVSFRPEINDGRGGG